LPVQVLYVPVYSAIGLGFVPVNGVIGSEGKCSSTTESTVSGPGPGV